MLAVGLLGITATISACGSARSSTRTLNSAPTQSAPAPTTTSSPTSTTGAPTNKFAFGGDATYTDPQGYVYLYHYSLFFTGPPSKDVTNDPPGKAAVIVRRTASISVDNVTPENREADPPLAGARADIIGLFKPDRPICKYSSARGVNGQQLDTMFLRQPRAKYCIVLYYEGNTQDMVTLESHVITPYGDDGGDGITVLDGISESDYPAVAADLTKGPDIYALVLLAGVGRHCFTLNYQDFTIIDTFPHGAVCKAPGGA